MNRKKDSGSGFWAGALIGAVAGAVAGVLFAPRSGKETRDAIKKKSKDYAEKSKKIVEKGKEKVQENIK